MSEYDVEDYVLLWLKGMATDGFQPFTEKPKTLPEKYILIDRTGGPREAMVLDRAEILIEVYHKTDKRAAKNKAREIASAIKELENVDSITHAAVNSMIRLDDTQTKSYRYQVYCDVHNRE